MELIKIILKIFHDNPWLAGGFTMLIGGGFLATLRSIPQKIYNMIKRQCIMSVDITDQDSLFLYFKNWLDNTEYSKNTQLLSISLFKNPEDNSSTTNTPSLFESEGQGEGNKLNKKVLLTPGPGKHIFWYANNLIFLERTREKSSGSQHKYVEQFKLHIFGRNRNLITNLMEDVLKYNEIQIKEKIVINCNVGNYWDMILYQYKRSIDSVIFPENNLNDLLLDIDTFQKSRMWYRTMGIPYHRGYLLYGIPGSGKSSIINVIASIYNLPIYSFNFNDLKDEYLIRLMSYIPENAIILMEDIDSFFTNREENIDNIDNTQSKKVALSTLLNVLDGLYSKDGNLVVMTTNYIEKLDNALIRPGRIDYKMYFDYATKEQIYKMFLKFFPTQNSFADKFVNLITKEISMAELQNYLFNYKNDINEAIKNIETINGKQES